MGGGGGRATTNGPNATAVRTGKRARCHVPSCALHPSQNIKRRDPPRPGCRATFVLLTPRAQPAARGRSGAGRPWGDRGVDICSPHPARGSRSSRSSFFSSMGKRNTLSTNDVLFTGTIYSRADAESHPRARVVDRCAQPGPQVADGKTIHQGADAP